MSRAKLFILIIALALFTAGALTFRSHRQQAVSGIIALGRFHQVTHKGSGTAVLYKTARGERRLKLTGFRTAPNPELLVGLIAAPDAFENETIERSGFVPLGELRQSEGEMIYPVPAGLDLNRYRAVTIWSRKYRVNFTTAPLREP